MRASDGHCATVAAALVVLLATAVAAARTTMVNECHSGDKAALLAIKAAFRNASYFDSWTPRTPCCEWAHVSCDSSASNATLRRVVALRFENDAGLRGPLPGAAIAGLTALQELHAVNVSGVTGTVPRELAAALPELIILEVSFTGMSGRVPAHLSEFAALGDVRLSYNRFAGPIPASLADMPSLDYLDLSGNRLTDPIPLGLFGKQAANGDVVSLSLAHNKFAGAIPADFAAVNFVTLDLSDNRFTGDASFLFGANKSLLDIDLSRNAFSFNLSNVQLPEYLNGLEISHNQIYGEIPPQIVDMMLNYLNVSYNRLTGKVPYGGFMADWFDQYCFQHNKGLCGDPLPPCK